MLKWLWTSEHLFFAAFTLYLCMQFAVTATAPHNIWFYGMVVPAALAYTWQHSSAGRALLANPSMRWMLLFFAYIVVHALIMAGELEGSSKVIRNTLTTTAFFSISTLFFSAMSDAARHRLFCAVALTAGFCALISIILYLTDPTAEERLRPIGRADTQVLGAFVYTIGAICALAALKAGQPLSVKAALCIALSLCCIVVLLTQSRVALAMLLFSIVTSGIYICRHHLKILALFSLFLLAGLAVFALMDDTLFHYIHGLIERGDSYRMELWSATIDKIMQAPWVGHGMLAQIDYYMTATYHTNSPHNIYLTTALALGIPGLAVLLVAIGHLLWRMAWELPFATHSVFFTGLLMANSLASGLIDHSRIVKGPSPLWIIFWLPLAMGVAELIHHRTSKPPLTLPTSA